MTIRQHLAIATAALSMVFAACNDKTTPILTQQTDRIDTELKALAEENPALISTAGATFANDTITVDVVLNDSLIDLSRIPAELFNYFTAVEVKRHIDKNLEITVNTLSEAKGCVAVSVTDAYGVKSGYVYTAADLRRMVKSPLSQLDFNAAKQALFDYWSASAGDFTPSLEKPVNDVTTSFKGGFYDYTVNFANARAYKGLTSANLKSRILKVLQPRYERLGTLRPAVLEMYKSLGIDGFHLIYEAEKGQPLKTSVTLNNLR